jgi:sulfite reductase (NADPH) flavoprotein alpha-component
LATPGDLHLTVDSDRYDIEHNTRFGVASTFLCDHAATGDSVNVCFHKAHGLSLPADPATSINMVGPGTGVAPFRSFPWHRHAHKRTVT